ncbi:MAG: tyrosine-type recombinase/integrase [Dehalococcoidia bacterium]
MRVQYSSPVAGLSAIRSETFRQLFGEYERKLLDAGYHHTSVRLQLHSIAHFGVWCEREDRRLETINEQALEAFEGHRSTCQCPASRNRSRQVRSCVRGLLRHLRERGVIPVEARRQPVRRVQEFLRWMRVERGVVESTLTSYGSYVGDLVRALGDDPRTYTARGLRGFVEQRCRHYRTNSSRMVVAAVRMFLRYLAVEGQCRPGLEHALISRAKWSHQSLPRGLSAEEVGRVIAGCPATPRGRRDRAVLLLLIRLGLRAGDVKRLRFSDLCFDTAAIRVSGKGGRGVRLPLPQDVGDALLEYLRAGRPMVDSEFVFFRSTAPFEPFALRPAGKAVGHIARAALKRADVHPPTRGAHIFRHTAACQLLREGVSLEGIAEVLRHRSVETTGLYAKVDVALLETVAQPWPEVVPC